jgi:DNA-binding HxlR family transcriptional regulator
MTRYGQYCPCSHAAEILGDRWTLLIVREMLYGSQHFNEIERCLPGISRALLAERLRRLREAGVIERRVAPTGRGTNYELTQAGLELQPVIDAIVDWGAKWAFGEPQPDELNPVLLLVWMSYGIHTDQLPRPRIVIEFDFRGACEHNYWMVLEQGDVSVCLKHPGFDRDILVSSDLAALYEVWAGYTTLGEAVRGGRIEFDGERPLVRAFPGWLALSPVAGAVQRIRSSS